MHPEMCHLLPTHTLPAGLGLIIDSCRECRRAQLFIGLPAPAPPLPGPARPYITCTTSGSRSRVKFSSAEAGIHLAHSHTGRIWVGPGTGSAMASRGPRPLLLLLLAACLALPSGHSWDPLHEIFKLKHVNHPRKAADNDNDYCNKMMWGRGLFLKPSNTFIADSPAKINCVCKKGGVNVGGLKYKSITTFDLTTCTKNHWTFSFDGIRHRHHIVVLCLHGRPIKLLKYV